MAWQDTLVALRNELAEVRAQRERRAATEFARLEEVRAEMVALVESLGASEMLSSMNAILLDGGGRVDVFTSWESDDDDDGLLSLDDDDQEDDDDDDEDIDANVLANVLTWQEDGDREIAVEVALTTEGIVLMVNGVEVRPERNALERAVVEAFREELGI